MLIINQILNLHIIAAYTAKKNEAKTKKMVLFKENKNKILKQNLTTGQDLKKIDTGIYDDGFAIVFFLYDLILMYRYTLYMISRSFYG